MLGRNSRRDRYGERGQALILALAFIAFFGVVVVAVLRFGDVTGVQHVHTEATAATDSAIEGGAAYAASDAADNNLFCSKGSYGQLTMNDGSNTKVGYTINSCDLGKGQILLGGTPCVLCLLNHTLDNGNVLDSNSDVTVSEGDVDVNGTVNLLQTSTVCATTTITDDVVHVGVLAGFGIPTPIASNTCTGGNGGLFTCQALADPTCSNPPAAPLPVRYPQAIGDPLQTKLPAPNCVSNTATCLWAASSVAPSCLPASCGKPTGCTSWAQVAGCTLAATSSTTVNPGLWASLTASGNSTVVTLNPGIYVFTGTLGATGNPGQQITTPQYPSGGTCTVNGSTTSTCGVMIYLACNNYGSGGQPCPAGPQTGGYIDLSGNGNLSLEAPNWGGYPGVVVLADFGRVDPHPGTCLGGGGNGNCLLSATGNGSSISGLVDLHYGGVSLGGGGTAVITGRLIANSLFIHVNGRVGTGLSLGGALGGAGPCNVYDDHVYPGGAALANQGRALIQSECGAGTTSGLIDINYFP